MISFDIITLFPNMFDGPFSESIIKRAENKSLININIHQLRNYATDKHKTVDDTPCGGGPGMVLKVDVIDAALSDIKNKILDTKNIRIILLSPKGQRFTQQKAVELAKYDNIVLLCGHYEGFDQRVHNHLVDEEISIGDYVLTGGEIPAMVLVDTITRMIPGVIREESALNESFMPAQDQILNIKNKKDNESPNKLASDSYSLNYDYPVYTRPIEYKGWKVPEVLRSGDHKEINDWRESKKAKRIDT